MDTGCSLNLISKDVFQKIPKKGRPEFGENEVRMTTADGSLLPDDGRIPLQVQVGMKMYEHPFIVAKLTNEGILGTYFLRTLLWRQP